MWMFSPSSDLFSVERSASFLRLNLPAIQPPVGSQQAKGIPFKALSIVSYASPFGPMSNRRCADSSKPMMRIETTSAFITDARRVQNPKLFSKRETSTSLAAVFGGFQDVALRLPTAQESSDMSFD